MGASTGTRRDVAFPGQNVANGGEVGAAVVVDDAFRIAGRARGVVERDRLPLIVRSAPGEIRIAGFEEGFVLELAETLAALVLDVLDVYDRNLPLQQPQGAGSSAGEFLVRDEQLRFAVLQHESDGFSVEPDVDGVQDRAAHRHAEVRFVHRRDVGQHHGHRVADADSLLRERGGEPATARVRVVPGETARPVDDGETLGIDRRGALDERKRSQGSVICRGSAEILLEFAAMRAV